ncbi:translocation protein SEC63 homolog isoform X5 [Salmo salar]|uniref:Translocation protein SEC63 homolog isoform X5 n=1 Tax=Salmo salar TaxID=8030 RepID=A0ABM3F1I6_SALSA|nr:translocation protein SEC63 homolog isoform X5 [Salmo salar]|eukprot:XP_014040693.1 PREDICTED: translocation protein SEC63 homolog isoform X2 [Salmo salar]
MAGQQFQYDDSGNTFFYFLTSFVGLIVIPATYYLWPRDQNAEQLRLKSLRKVHGRCLWYRLRLMKAQQSIIPTLKKAALLFGWAVFLLLAYKVSKLDREYQEYNPYEVLGLDQGASVSEIKKQYRLLSLKFHPDKGGDEDLFMRIAKAHSALTNDESRQNWETYGNPDGPRATSFGIALPAWIVDSKNSMLVLLVYGLAFMVILPVVVGTWWYRSIRYSGDQILINTTQLFMHFMYKTPNMNMKRLSMVLTAAFEFDPRSNKEATIRPTDNIQVPQLIRELGNINVKKKEPPFCYPYSLKARVLVMAHLARMEVSDDIEEDQRFVVRKSPALLQEMVNVGCQLTMMANSRGGFHAPRLVSIENCMKLTQMIVQGLQESKSPLLQLPHFEEEHLRYCVSKKYKVRSLQDLVSLKDSDRRSMLRFLGEEKYDEVMAVLASFPSITMDTKLQVLDDEDSNNITAGSIVTVTVTLTRKRMAEVFEKEQNVTPCLVVGEEASTEDAATQGDVSKTKAKVWQNKTKAAKKTKQSKKKKLTKKKPLPLPAAKAKQANGSASGSEVVAVAKEDEEDGSDKGSESEEGEGNKDSPSERDEESDKQSDTEQDEIAGDDEEEWEALQQSIQRRERALLETKSKVTHPVYSLYYPEEKHEWWWLYIADRKDQTLVSMPYHVCTLKDTEEVELKFPAPSKTGNFQYSVILRSDSYLGLDQIRPLKLEVHEAKAVLCCNCAVL